MDPLTLVVLGTGGYLGVKKVWPWLKEKSASIQSQVRARVAPQGQPQAFPMQLDPGMNPNQTAEVANLLTNVRNADLVQSGAALYRTMNFPLAASVLEARASALRAKL